MTRTLATLALLWLLIASAVAAGVAVGTLLAYIASRYGSPCRALDHALSAGWY